MKAAELMLGDYVSHFNEEKKCVVIELRGRKVAVSYTDDNGNTKYSELLPEMAFEPIPLTAEILEKNGFKKELSEDNIHYRFILIYDGIRFSLLYARSVFQWMGPLDFKYVHELQHALRLCGIDKEIEL